MSVNTKKPFRIANALKPSKVSITLPDTDDVIERPTYEKISQLKNQLIEQQANLLSLQERVQTLTEQNTSLRIKIAKMSKLLK